MCFICCYVLVLNKLLMKIYFRCTFEGDTKRVKSFLKENGYTLVSKRIKNPNTIVIDSISKEYTFTTTYFYGSVHKFWLLKAMLL